MQTITETTQIVKQPMRSMPDLMALETDQLKQLENKLICLYNKDYWNDQDKREVTRLQEAITNLKFDLSCLA
jgi:hypothetical protein